MILKKTGKYTHTMLKGKSTLFLIIISYVLLFIIQGLLFLVLFVFLKNKPETNNWGILITNISLILVIWGMFKIFNLKLNKQFKLPNIKVLIYIILLAICFAIAYPLMSFLSFAINISNNSIKFTNFNLSLETSSSFYYFSIVFISPVLEEFYYRKIILNEISKKYNSFWAILISSILFSLMHMDYVQCQISFLFGLLAGYLYLKTNKIEFTILLHSLVNLLIIITSSKLIPFDTNYYLVGIYIFVILIGYILMRRIIKNAIH